MSILSRPYFHDEAKAFEHVESVLWPNGPVCPHCGSKGRISKIKPNPERRVRLGLHKCGTCKKQFTVRVGTVFEASKVELYKWLQAVHLMSASKKGVSAHQLHRILEVTYKTAWFMAHRIREAMRSGGFSTMGGGGGIVEIDETYVGVTDKGRKLRANAKAKGRKHTFHGGYGHKMSVVTLIDRTGAARSFQVDKATKKTVLPILRENLDKEARVITDDSSLYRELDREYAHAFVPHNQGVWGRGEIHTNTIEGFFSIFKRGMKGVYQHCSEKHLHRYLAEFDFRYNNRMRLGVSDVARVQDALLGARGKRLFYHQPA